MLINSQKNSYLPTLQSSKSSSINLSRTGASNQDSIVKKIALAVINLLLIPFRLAQSAYYKLFKVEVDPKAQAFNNFFDEKFSIKELIAKNKPTIIKTALIGIGISSLIALGYKPSHQKGLLEDSIDSIVKFISSNKLLPLSALGLGIGSIIFIKGKCSRGNPELNKIKDSSECNKVLSQILNSKSLSDSDKLDSIKAQLHSEVKNFRIAEAQTVFMRILLTKLQIDSGSASLKKLANEVNSIINKDISPIDKANLIRKAFIEVSNSDISIEDAIKNTGLGLLPSPIIHPLIENLSNMEILELDLSIENTNSIVSFVEGIRKVYIAEAQIHFSDVLVDSLQVRFSNDGRIKTAIDGLKNSINSIKDDDELTLVEKSNRINNVWENFLENDLTSKGLHLISTIDFLSLENKGLKAVLPFIGKFKNLKRLSLAKNNLISIPEYLGNLPNLQELTLSTTQLTFVPESIGNLNGVTTLDLANNQLTFIPKFISNLPKLKTLELGKNRFQLPSKIGKLELKKPSSENPYARQIVGVYIAPKK